VAVRAVVVAQLLTSKHVKMASGSKEKKKWQKSQLLDAGEIHRQVCGSGFD
jgi:hypothetical protein